MFLIKRMCTKILSLSLIFVLLFGCFSGVVFAYDVSAAHPDANKEFSDAELDAAKLKMWKTIRSWGWSEAATAGMMGNIWGESRYAYTAIQSGGAWSAFEYGVDGLGMNQWTDSGRQKNLFAKCDEMGKQWTDLDAQLAHLRSELEGSYAGFMVGYFADGEEFKNTTDWAKASDAICDNFESPAVNNFGERQAAAKEALDKYAGTAFDDLNTTTPEKNESVETAFVVEEWDLVGMPGKSAMLDNANAVKLPTKEDLSPNEAYSVNIVKENILLARESSVFDILRQAVVTVGLVLVLYGVLLSVAFIFDRVNVLLDMSLVTVLTAGRVKPVFEEDGVVLTGGMLSEGYMEWRKFTKVVIVILLFGFFLVSGGVFSVILAPSVDYLRSMSIL